LTQEATAAAGLLQQTKRSMCMMINVLSCLVTNCLVTNQHVCVQVGNTGPVQEFNIQVDPEAAKVVFEAGAWNPLLQHVDKVEIWSAWCIRCNQSPNMKGR
jgi:hypothetical protein